MFRRKEGSLSSKRRDTFENRVWNIVKIIVCFLVVRSFERFISRFTRFLQAEFTSPHEVVNYSNELLFSNAMIRERWGK